VDLVRRDQACGLQVRRHARAVLTHGGSFVARTEAAIQGRVDTLRDAAVAGEKTVPDAD
jgi:hypothetical protein